jgi:hypothetical protein
MCLVLEAKKRSNNAKCDDSVAKFVGVKHPVPQVIAVDDAEEHGTSWNISEIEHLSQEAAVTKKVTIIHLLEDRVSSLHSQTSILDDV